MELVKLSGREYVDASTGRKVVHLGRCFGDVCFSEGGCGCARCTKEGTMRHFSASGAQSSIERYVEILEDGGLDPATARRLAERLAAGESRGEDDPAPVEMDDIGEDGNKRPKPDQIDLDPKKEYPWSTVDRVRRREAAGQVAFGDSRTSLRPLQRRKPESVGDDAIYAEPALLKFSHAGPEELGEAVKATRAYHQLKATSEGRWLPPLEKFLEENAGRL